MVLNRYDGIVRPYSWSDVKRLQGRTRVKHTLAEEGAERLWKLMTRGKDSYVRALGASTGNVAVQQVKAGLEAIYCSGWQVAADANTSGNTYPDQSLYPVDSVPTLVKRINSALLRAEQIDALDGGDKHWLAPIVADAEAGFGGPLNAYELVRSLVEAGAAGIHLEDQLASAKKCGHMGGKVLVSTSQFVQTLIAARLACDVMEVPTVIIARTDALNAQLLTSDIDPRDQRFVDTSKERTVEGFWRLREGRDVPMQRTIARAEAYAPYADVLWFETSEPDMHQAWQFADAIRQKFPGKVLAYNCFGRETQFITDEGVKSFEDHDDGDVVTVLTHLGNWKRAVVRCYGQRKLNHVKLRRGGKGSRIHTVRVTGDHRWLLANGEETTALQVGDRLLSGPYMGNTDIDYDDFSFEEKLYWCYGYVYGDGTRIKGKGGEYVGSCVRLCKKDARYRERFEELGFKTSTNLSLQGDFYAYTGSYLKTLPDLGHDAPNLVRAFLCGWLDADGTKAINGNGVRYKGIQTTGELNVEYLRRALPMCGFYITSTSDHSGEVTNYGPRTGRTVSFALSTNKPRHYRDWVVTDVSEASVDEVWCLEVDDDHSFVMPCGVATGNCSPSFNWKKHLSDVDIARFQDELGKMGYAFQFVTLASFHAMAHSMFTLAHEYQSVGMPAYAKLQAAEFESEKVGYTATKHQREVGTGYFDAVATIISGGSSSTLAMHGSTETAQFTEHGAASEVPSTDGQGT